MRAEATILVTWFPQPGWGATRAECWLTLGDKRPSLAERISMGGPEKEAVALAESVHREARDMLRRYVPGEADERDTGWSRARRRDGTVRYSRTVSLTGPIG